MTANGSNYNKSEILEWVKSIGLAVIIALIIKSFLLDTTLVNGHSMNPTLEHNDRLFINKTIQYMGEIKKGDIVVLKAPDDDNKDYIKRVVAVEDDTIKVKNGKVYVNNEEITENYIKEGIYTHGDVEITVPKGQVFVLGDNRERYASKDSRYFGPVFEDSIKGRAFFRYFPFDDRFGGLN